MSKAKNKFINTISNEDGEWLMEIDGKDVKLVDDYINTFDAMVAMLPMTKENKTFKKTHSLLYNRFKKLARKLESRGIAESKYFFREGWSWLHLK